MRDLCWISCFCCFSCAFYVLLMKSATFHENKQDQVNMCVYIYHQISPKCNRYLVGLPSVLYERPGQNKRPVLNQLFLLIFSAFHRKCWFHTKSVTFHENQQNQVNMCVYMYHLYIHAPPNYQQKMIYLVDLASVLYERPGQNERPVLNQMFFRCCFSGAFHVFFMKSTTFHTKSATFNENKQDQVNMCVYIYHQISPKYNIYLVGLPCELYERPGQNKRPVLNQLFLLLFRYFQCFSHTFHKKHHCSYKSGHVLWKQTKLGQYVCIHAPFTHTCTTCTTKYHQNIRYT